MPSTTPRGYPYPLPTEPVAEGAAAIRALAEAVDVGGMQLIETKKLSATGAMIFSAIPQTFAHLLAVGSVRLAVGATNDPLQLRFNNDAGPGYRSQQLSGVGAGPASVSEAAPSGAGQFAHGTGANYAGGLFSNFELLIPVYRDIGHLRTWLSRGFSGWGASGIVQFNFGGFYWGSPAVTRLDLFGAAPPQTFLAGSTVSLYGLAGGAGYSVAASRPGDPDAPEPKDDDE